jgi:hypothetical protein
MVIGGSGRFVITIPWASLPGGLMEQLSGSNADK